MKILVIDNYDSFTYNLVHYIENLTEERIDVYRNDEISIKNVGGYDKILLSPGPGIPNEAGICLELIDKYASSKSIFGVCLGHQAIAEAFGGKLKNLTKVYHGVETPVKILHPSEKLFKGLPSSFQVGRYHSWVVSKEDLPDTCIINSEDEEGTIMGLSHTSYDVKGLQFHPESVLTQHGMSIMNNWINEK